MKYIWSEEDIKCGLIVCRNQHLQHIDGTFKPDSWQAKWTHKIGFIGNRKEGTVLISMADGMVGSKKTPKVMAEYLTKNDMMPMPHDWLIQIFNYMRDWYKTI